MFCVKENRQEAVYGAAPIYIIGVGRSGTSLLHSMLAAHSEVAFPPETGFVRRFIGARRLALAMRARNKSKIVSLLCNDKRVARISLPIDDVVTYALSRHRSTPATLYREMLKAYADRVGKKRFGDKDPRATELLRLLKKVLPDAHIVHIIRDPRDILLSKKNAAWSGDRSAITHIFANRVQLRMGREGRRLFGQRYHEVFYEALIADPEGELRKLCRDLGLSYEASMLNFQDSANALVSPAEMSWKKETLGPLLKTQSGKWEGSLSIWEIALTELCCALSIKAGGYKNSRAVKRLSGERRAAIYVTAGLIVCLDPVYQIFQRWRAWLPIRWA